MLYTMTILLLLFGVVVSDICLRGYPSGQTVKTSSTSGATTQTGDIFTIGSVGSAIFVTNLNMDSTFTATNGSISAKDSENTRKFISNNTSGTKN